MMFVLGLAVAVAAGMCVGPGVASMGDLSSWGGVLDCNASETRTHDCPGSCTATYQNYWVLSGSNGMLCAEYNDPRQCNVSGCTGTYDSIQCGTECNPT